MVDAERLFSPKLAAFMQQKGYHFEASYITTVWNWRRASDERGLSRLQMILTELMPWYRGLYDFSLLEVNRYI